MSLYEYDFLKKIPGEKKRKWNGGRYYDRQGTCYHCSYRAHFVCFSCQYGWKCQQSNNQNNKCGKCGRNGISVGIDCRIPKKNDNINWQRLEYLVKNDQIIFQASDCELMHMYREYKQNTIPEHNNKRFFDKNINKQDYKVEFHYEPFA